jgi:RNA polymerase sigma factor (sigma-70 family)
MPAAPDPGAALAAALSADRGRIMAALIARISDFQRAEDALHDAAASALVHWGRSGVPDRPDAWLIRVAFRKAIDQLRKSQRDERQAQAMAVLARDEASEDPELIADERLRLIFTCCHPALEPKSRVALTLRTVCGLSTLEIARAFLDGEATMGQRLSRAKAKIAGAGIPFVVPEPEDWSERLQSVLTVIYLIFNAGYSAGPATGRDLCDEAIFLARLLDQLRPEEAEVEGCLALMLLTHARRAARINQMGETVPPDQQDRLLWDHAKIAEGTALIDRAVARAEPGPHQIKAAIAALHVQAEPNATDWRQITLLYDGLYRIEPSPVVRLNRAVAMARAGGLDRALREVRELAADLEDYQPFHAAHADLLARAGLTNESVAAYSRAIALARASPDAAFLARKRDQVLNHASLAEKNGVNEKKGRA